MSKHVYTKTFIESLVRSRYEDGLPVNPGQFRFRYPSMRKRVDEYYGGWDGLYLKLNINPNEVRTRKKWTKDLITSKIKEYRDRGYALNSVAVKSYDASLYNAARRSFGDWGSAIKGAGLEYLPVEDLTNHALCGFAFEQLVKDIYIALGYSFKYNHVVDDSRPDFTFEDGSIVDAKLNSWTVFGNECQTIKKYTELTDHLTIVYLNGREISTKIDKVDFVSVDAYINSLADIGRYDLVDRVDELRTKVNELNKMSA